MKCMLCGTSNRGEALRCKGCGASLGKPSPTPPPRTPSPTVLEPSATSQARVARKTRIAAPEEIAQAAAISSSLKPAAPLQTPSNRRRRTVYQSPGSASGGEGGEKAAPAPRIFGMLVTYSWKEEGQVFLLREGKNIFGSSSSLEGSLPKDTTMSGEHFTVMYRKDKIRVRDLDSTNATQVDGEEIWGDSVAAAHGSMIEAGNTRFTLVVIPKENEPSSPQEGP